MDEKKSCTTNYTDGINYHQLCITEDMWCDGIPQCPDLSDEELKECTKYFPTNSMDVNAFQMASLQKVITFGKVFNVRLSVLLYLPFMCLRACLLNDFSARLQLLTFP